MPVFGILKRDGKVYTQMIKNASSKELIPIIEDIVEKKSTEYTDKWKGYDSLLLNGYKHKRINHSRLFVDKEENMWIKKRIKITSMG